MAASIAQRLFVIPIPALATTSVEYCKLSDEDEYW
jgi:hypothetical protein